MPPNAKRSFIDRLRTMRETRFGSFVPVLLALAAIWIYFGIAAPLLEHWSDQGLMQKILPTGNLNIGDPFVRGIARVLLPDSLGLLLAGALVLIVFILAFRGQSQRKARGLELDSTVTILAQYCRFACSHWWYFWCSTFWFCFLYFVCRWFSVA